MPPVIVRLARRLVAGDDDGVSLRRWFIGGAAVTAVGGCVAIAGVGDYAVDPCLDPGGCLDASAEGAPPDAAPPTDGGGEASTNDGGLDAPNDGPITSPGLSAVTLGGTGVAVGHTIVATLTTRDDTGNDVPRSGSKVVFVTSGGTGQVSIGPVTDVGNGTYRAVLTGVAEGTPLTVSATLDGAPLKVAGPKLRVVNRIGAGLAVELDAENVDRLGNAGAKGCPATGPLTWTDLGAGAMPGTFVGFAGPCGLTSGWGGSGAPGDPAHVSFDGVDDAIDFGTALAPLSKYTVLAWVRMSGDGVIGDTGVGGIRQGFPVVAKGANEATGPASAIDFHLSITQGGHAVGFTYDPIGSASSSGIRGASTIALSQWVMIGATLDASTATRQVWLDGKVDVSVAPPAAPALGANTRFVVGGSNKTNGTGAGRFKGDVAVVLVYDRALTQDEIRASCHSYSSRFEAKGCAP